MEEWSANPPLCTTELDTTLDGACTHTVKLPEVDLAIELSQPAGLRLVTWSRSSSSVKPGGEMVHKDVGV